MLVLHFRWRKIFNSRIATLVKSTGNYAFVVSVLIMVFLFVGEIYFIEYCLAIYSICELVDLMKFGLAELFFDNIYCYAQNSSSKANFN